MKNVYEAEGNLQFTAAKTMEGRPLEEGEFTFRIYEGDTLKAEAQNGAGGVILFPEINYKADDAGRHTYTIMEQKGTSVSYTHLILCSRKRQPGKGVHGNPDADSKEPGNRHFCGGACDKGRRGGRPQGTGTYGGYGTLF